MKATTTTNIATALISSAVTAVIVNWWTRKWLEKRRKEYNDDEFDAGQGQPQATNKDDDNNRHVPYHHQRLPLNTIRYRSQKLLRNCRQRRTLRFFSPDPVPKDIIDDILQTACTAPSGAHKQPWTFVAVSNKQIKQSIRSMVEEEETTNYKSRMRKSWVDDLKPMMQGGLHDQLDGDERIQKPYLTEAPWIIAVFKQTHGGVDMETGKRIDHYYVQESVGIACGMLCVAIQNANLVTLTSTPMGAEKGIRTLLGRPDNEKLFLLLPVGFPSKDATVPYRKQERKPSSETILWKL